MSKLAMIQAVRMMQRRPGRGDLGFNIGNGSFMGTDLSGQDVYGSTPGLTFGPLFSGGPTGIATLDPAGQFASSDLAASTSGMGGVLGTIVSTAGSVLQKILNLGTAGAMIPTDISTALKKLGIPQSVIDAAVAAAEGGAAGGAAVLLSKVLSKKKGGLGLAGTMRKHRRMNALNPRALRRSMRRVKSFAHFAHETMSFTKTHHLKTRHRRR